MSSYKAIIKNISQNEWLVDWYDGVIALNKFKKYATEFFDEAEAGKDRYISETNAYERALSTAKAIESGNYKQSETIVYQSEK